MKIVIQVLYVLCVAFTFEAAPQNDDDEGKPYEFGFTIDGQQHRHEKKDVNGIIQGEFGFITADGVYHVTVYATDENGNFRILSMRNVRISAPLDGSGTPEQRQLDAPKPKPNTLSPPTTPRPRFTTQSTIKPACAGCGYVTTSKTTPASIPIQNPEFRNVYDVGELPVGPPGEVAFPQPSSGAPNAFVTDQPPEGPPLEVVNEVVLPEDDGYNDVSLGVRLQPQAEIAPPAPPAPTAPPETLTVGQRQRQGKQLLPGQGFVEAVFPEREQYSEDDLKSPEYGDDSPGTRLAQVSVQDGVIKVPGNPDIPIRDKFPNMEDGLPNGVQEKDISDLLYKFNYTVGFHGHYEKGYKNGAKVGGYFVNGRDGLSRVVTYVADENGYRPKFKLIRLGLDSPDTPKAETEKSFGLKNFEFVWYPIS